MFRFTQHDRRVREARLPHRFATANPSCGGLGSLVLLFARGLHDLGEAARVEAGSANEGAVDVWLAHQFVGILRFHAAAVLDPDSLGCGLIGHFAQRCVE